MTPYSPVHLLTAWWQENTAHASYSQQDAHEFFVSYLTSLDQNLRAAVDSGRSQFVKGKRVGACLRRKEKKRK